MNFIMYDIWNLDEQEYCHLIIIDHSHVTLKVIKNEKKNDVGHDHMIFTHFAGLTTSKCELPEAFQNNI